MSAEVQEVGLKLWKLSQYFCKYLGLSHITFESWRQKVRRENKERRKIKKYNVQQKSSKK